MDRRRVWPGRCPVWPVWRLLLTLGPLVCHLLRAAEFSSSPEPAHIQVYDVYPGQSIQHALDQATAAGKPATVKVHAGTYRPTVPGQALVWFNARHDGLVLEAEGEVILTASNPSLANRSAASFPAVVNHVVYFGDGISRKTVLRGFKITGGNNFVTDKAVEPPMEPHFEALRQTEGYYGHLFFYTDGAGIKIFGRSCPTIDGVEIYGNYASPCAGGISIEQRGFKRNPVLITNCVFRENRALVTGAAIDLLPGSAAEIHNCLFVGNLSNRGADYRAVEGNINWPNIPQLMESAVGYQPAHGSGALTVFPRSAVVVDRCTFTGNFNGADDKGSQSVYRNSIFWMNTAGGGVRPGRRYELDVARGDMVQHCFIHGEIDALQRNIHRAENTLECPNPEFDREYRPQNPLFSTAGYRPPAP